MYILNIEVSYLSLIHQIKPSENLYDLRGGMVFEWKLKGGLSAYANYLKILLVIDTSNQTQRKSF